MLPWPFTVTGGVNQVVNSLIREFEAREVLGLKPLAIELHWDACEPKGTLPTGTAPIRLRLHAPYVSDKELRSILSFLWHLPRELFALRRLAKRYNIAAFNIHFPDLQALSFVLLRMFRLFEGQIILSVHGSDIRSAHQERGFPKALWKFLLRNASAVVACSKGLAEEVLLLEPRSRTATIYNGIKVEPSVVNGPPSLAWPAALEGRRVIANIASFEYRKGHDILISAFEDVVSRHKDAALLLIGRPGPVSGSVRQMIRDKRLEDSVHILESVPHSGISGLLAQSTLFALASRWRKCEMGEGFAIAILEAAAAKTPVVAVASCGVEEIIVDGQTGRVVPLEDPKALAFAICELLDDPITARRAAEGLYKLVREQFTWERAADQYAALCKRP